MLNITEKENLRQLTLIIPHLPYAELNPNSRVHWAVKARAVKASKEEVGWLAKAQWGDQKPMVKARIHYEFFAKNQRRRDLDNLLASMKYCPDSLIEVDVLFYDDAKHLQFGISSLTTDIEDRTIAIVEEMM